MSKPSEKIKIVVVGAGGLGAPVMWGLAEYFSLQSPNSDYAIELIDDDLVELSNFNRQIFFKEHDIGKHKTKALKKGLEQCLNRNLPNIRTHNTKLQIDNITQLLTGSNIVLDCTDNTETKFLLNDFCVLQKIPLVHAGASGGIGQVMAIDSSKNSPCLRCLFGNFSENDYKDQTTTCRHAGIFGAFVGMVGFLQVKLAISLLKNETETLSHGHLYRIDYPSLEERSVAVKAAKDCPLGCSTQQKTILDLADIKCPETYLYTKLKLEQMPRESLLDVRLSSLESISNVSKSVQEEGFSLLGDSLNLSKDLWSLRILC